MIKRSICMPSNRRFGKSNNSILSAARYCNFLEGNLSVSDNSLDDSKNKMWNRHAFYYKSAPCGMIENFYNSFNKTTGDFVLIMGDDDRIFQIDDRLGSLCSGTFDVAPDVVGIHPNVVAFTEKNGIIRGDATEINAATATGRIQQHAQQCQGANLAFFSFWRRDVLKSLMDLWFLHHPTKATYCDWAVMNALASSGKVIRDNSTVYFYDISNWTGDDAFIKSQVERAFVASGLPKEAAQYASLFQAIDSFIFINRKDSPIPEGERLEAAQACLGTVGFDWDEALKTVGSFGLEEKYQQFYLHATGKDWGRV